MPLYCRLFQHRDEVARARSETLERLQHYRETGQESLDDLASEERHRIYKLLSPNVYARPDWPLEITGVFADVEYEAGMSFRPANLRHMAYKGIVSLQRPEEETGGVR